MKRVAIVLLLAACGDDGGMATVDAPPDPCMPDMQFTGEFVDWDSSATAFKGIFGARFTLESDPTKTTMTAPNGRFILCVPAADGLATVMPMTGTASDYVGGTVKIDKTVIQTGAMLSYRSFTAARAADFGFDTAKASVFVHVDNGMRTVTTTDAPTVKKHFDGTTWADGNTGTDIYLGGISGTMTSLSVSGGGATGASSIPIAPGQFTWITIIAK
jgi:hypothetical protein